MNPPPGARVADFRLDFLVASQGYLDSSEDLEVLLSADLSPEGEENQQLGDEDRQREDALAASALIDALLATKMVIISRYYDQLDSNGIPPGITSRILLILVVGVDIFLLERMCNAIEEAAGS